MQDNVAVLHSSPAIFYRANRARDNSAVLDVGVLAGIVHVLQLLADGVHRGGDGLQELQCGVHVIGRHIFGC